MSIQPLVATAITSAAVTAMGYLCNKSSGAKHIPQKPINFEETDNKTSVSDTNKIIFIPKKYTEKAISDDYISERFKSKEQLFYYLRWRAIIDSIHGNLKVYKGILIFCTDLHCKHNSQSLYVIGAKNDKANTNNKRIEKWKMNEYFMTASEIASKYGLSANNLPKGSETILQTIYNRVPLRALVNKKNNILASHVCNLPIIKTNKVKSDRICHNQSVMKYSSSISISQQTLMSQIRNSDLFVPIISFNENKRKYFVDMVLMVRLNNNWIGVVFGQRNGYSPIGIGIDFVDMTNKMNLFRPAMNTERYTFDENKSIHSLHIYDDSRMSDSKDAMIAKLMKENERLQQQNAELTRINNWYFIQTFDPKNQLNITPHSVHLSNDNNKYPPLDMYKVSVYQMPM